MSPPPRYYLALDGQVSGPHGLEALREMASVQAFTRDTLATTEGTENWLPIHAIPGLADALFPVSAKFQLKEKVIIETADSNKPVVVEDILRDNLTAETGRVTPVDYTTRPSRPPGANRRRDFPVSIVCANALGLTAYLLLPAHPAILVPLLAYFVIINIGLYWTFYHVMDRY